MFVDDAPVLARGKLNIREDRANSLLIDEIKPLGEANRTTAFTNVFSGRLARGIVNRLMRDLGPLSDLAPAFPAAADAIAPLRHAAEAANRDDFSPLWAGEAYALAKPMSSAELTRALGRD